MAKFYDTTASIKKEAGKRKKKQETPQPQKVTQSPSVSQTTQQTTQRLTQKYGGGGSGGTTRTTTSRTTPQRTTQAQNQKMYGQPTQPTRRNQAELQRQAEERRKRGQQQKSGQFEKPISRAQYADKNRATTFREKYTRWDNDIADTVTHTLKQSAAEDKRFLNKAARGITLKDRHQYATPEQIRKADERTERRDRKYAAQIEKEGQELEKLKEGHSYLGKQALSAVSSATGMAADLAVGAATGTGSAGSLGHMFMRSTGGAYGQVKNKANVLRKQLESSGNYSKEELDEMFKDVDARDELNALASGGIEVLSERLFTGFGPAAKYLGKSGSIAERAAGKLFKKAGGKATSGMLKNALRGTAEEVAEEEIAGPLQALAANTIYGNKYQAISEDAVRREFKAESDALRSQIHSDEDAQMISARLNSTEFRNDSIKSYMDAGMSESEAAELADLSKEYLTASLTGDLDRMADIQEQLVKKLSGGENSLREKFTFRDALDAAVSTSMMTLPTGLPGAINSAQIGRSYKGTQGLEGVRGLAEIVRNWDTDRSSKAQTVIDAIDNGSDISDTQVYELIQQAANAAEAQSDAEATKEQIARRGMERSDLRVEPATRDENGNMVMSENTKQRYTKIVNDTVSRYESLAKIGEDAKFAKSNVRLGAELAAAQMTGVITAEDVHDLVKADPEVKAVFEDVTGIALDQFTKLDRNGNIDIAATNNTMMNALMAEAANNYINSARLEQAAWNNEVRGEMLQVMSENIGSAGDQAAFDALQNVDPRDRNKFMLMGTASGYVYEHGWSTQDTWEEAKGTLQRMFPSLDMADLKGVYEAAKADRIESETPYLNAKVKAGEALSSIAEGTKEGEIRGKFKNTTKRVLNAEEKVICDSLAKEFNANIFMVGAKNKNLSYIDENGETKHSNAAVRLSKGEIYISRDADIGKIIHEVTHLGAKLASDQYLDMAHYIMDKAYKHSPEQTRMLVEAYKRTYQGQGLTEAEIEEEVVADIVSVFEHDRVFIREIAEENPSLFRRIYNAICDVIRSIRNILATGRILDPELQDTFLAEIGAYEETRRMWLGMMKEAARNNAAVGVATWERNAYKDSRESRKMSDRWENGEKLTQKQFNSFYSAHKLNFGAAQKGDLAETIESIKANGFTSNTALSNVVPAGINDYTDPERPNYTQGLYGARKGDTVLLVPKPYLDAKNDQVKNGFIPRDYEIVEVERDFQPYYELYEKAYDESTEDAEGYENEIEANETRFSIVENPELIKELEDDSHVTSYRAMALIDGKLYPPMASKIQDESGKWNLQQGIELGQWVQADATTDSKMFNDKGQFHLMKDNGDDLWVSYNPYIHSSDSMMNDQFSSYHKRPNLVVVEGEIPESELTNGYRAETTLDDGRVIKAKDTTGPNHTWNSGVVFKELKKQLGKRRTVYLTNHFKPVRIVPDTEVAQHINSLVSDTNITIPYNVVPSGVRKELLKLGTTMAQSKQKTYSAELDEEDLALIDQNPNATRYSISGEYTIKDGNARWTDERIDDLIERYGAKGSENYSQAYAVLINPRDFLRITMEDELLRKWRESAASQPEGLTYKEGQRAVWDKSYLSGTLLDDQNFPLDEAELRNQTQTPFLYIRSSNIGQRVLGHEGRHRMRALMEAGVRSVPVVIQDPDTKTSKQNVDSMVLGYQEDVYNGAGIVKVNDLVPIKESNREELIQKFGGDAQVRFSITPEMDDEYMDAVNSGNMEEAQKYVDEAAKRAMPNTKLKGRWYHGTENVFTEFNFSQGGKNGTADGFGIYLTNDPGVASSYGNRMIEGYVNVTRPASALTSQTLTKSELRRLIKRTVEDEALQMAEDYDSNIEEAKFDTWISNYTDTRYAGNIDKAIDEVIKGITSYNGNDMDIVQEIMVGMGIRNYEDATRFYDILTETTGIDGFETKWGDESEMADPNSPTIALAFRSNQIKSSDPVTYAEDGSVIPLSERFDPNNNDIRYSLPTQDSDGNILSDGQMEYFKNSQARDEDGRLVPVYHTTNKGGFTIFDPMKSDDHRSLFFTNDRNMSASYSKQEGVNPAIINPYDEALPKRTIDDVTALPDFGDLDVSDKDVVSSISNIHVMNRAGEVIASGDDFYKVAQEVGRYLESDGYDLLDDFAVDPALIEDGPWGESLGDAWELYNSIRNAGLKYTMDYGNPTVTYSCYLNLENPMIIDGRGQHWDEINVDGEMHDTRGWSEIAYNQGYDGVVIRDIVDYGDSGYGLGANDVFIAFSSEQIKDIRNENPTENPDIRYSKMDEDEAMSIAAHDYAYDTSHEMLLHYEDMMKDLADKDTSNAFRKAKKYVESDVDKFYSGLTWYADGMKFDDPVLEEGRERMASSKADFFSSNEARWNERWLTEGRVLDARTVRSPIRKLVMSVMENADTEYKYKTDIVNKTIVDVRMAYDYAKAGRTEIADALLWHSALRMVDGVDFIDDSVYKDYKGLRDYLRTAKISLSEEYWADVDYQAFRKRNYNKINLVSGETNVDQIYQELTELYPEWFSEDEDMTPPDQLARMEQVLDAIQPYTIAYSSEEAADMAFDIASDLTRIMMEEGKEYKSIADRYKEKYEQRTKALKERHQEALREVEEKSKDLDKKAKAKFKEYKAEQREKKYHDKYFDSIKKSHDELVKRLRTNTKDKHIPEQYKRELAALLAAFDFQTVRSKKMEVKKGKDGYERLDVSKKTIQLRQLQGILKGIEQNTQFFRVNDSITDIMDSLLGIELGKYSEAMNVEGKTIDELNSEQLKRIDKMLKSLIHEFNNYENVRVGKKKQKAADIGSKQIESSLAYAAKYGPGKDYHNFVGALDRIINMDEMTPAYLFKQIDAEGDGIGVMFGELRKSFDKYVRNQAQLNEWMGEIVGKYHEKGILWNKYGSGELSKWRSVNQQKEFVLENGKSVKLTPAQMMSIHCLAKRPQAYNHMTGAGIVVKPVSFEAKLISDLKQKANYALPVKLSDADISMIENELTPEQMEVADKLQKLMAENMAEWGNEASMSVLGIRLFEDKEYFPIKSDRAALEKDFTAEQFNDMIRNFGFTKAVAPGAKNAIAIDDIFDVVSEHCNNMNLYNAYTETLNDFTKVYNYHQLGPDNSDYSVEQAIAHAYSQKATTFIRTFIQDLNGNVSRGRTSGLNDVMNDMLGKAKKASVFANGRVALQQPTALVRAFAVIDPKYLKGAKAPTKENLQEMFDHCPIALWKSWGFYDINMGKSIEDLMMNNGSWAEDKMSDIYGKLDNATWCVLWNMCKAEVKEKNPDVQENTDEFWELCNERMTEVVDLTQVVDSPFHRSHAMRSKDILHKMTTAFMAEPTLTFNMVRDGVKRAVQAYKDKDMAKASRILGRTASVFVTQAAAVAGAAAIWDAVRDKGKGNGDDDDQSVFELWWMNAVENFKDNLNLFNNVYYVKDIVSLFQGWDQKNLGLQGFVHLRDAWNQLTGKKTSYSKLTWYQNALAGIGYLTGTPYKTIMNDGKAILNLLGLHPSILDSFDSQLMNFQSAVQDLMGGEAAANGFSRTYDSGSKSTDNKKEAKAESGETALPTAVRGWTYEEAPFHVEDGSLADKFLNHFGVNLTAAEINAIEEAEAEKALKAKIDDIKAKTESLSGEEKDKKIWSYVQSYMKAENGDKSWSELVAEGDYASVGSIEAMYIRAGGNVEYFDGRIMAESKSALKKSISSDNTPEQIHAQSQIRDYLLNNGMAASEVSEISYKSYTARDLKVAFRLNDTEAITTELRALVQAGLTEEDYQKLWDNRNRIDIKKYKESGGKYADRLKSTGVYNWPISGSITSRFGHRSSPGGVGSTNHQGLDIAGSMGDPIAASDGGTVVFAGWYGGAGKTVMIEHDDGTVTQYSHMSWYDAQVGDIVGQGQYIGKVGSTGNSTGPHLHFGVKKNGVYQDPEAYLAKS